MKKSKFIVAAILCLMGLECGGQDFALSTNALDYLNLGTFNAEMSYSVARHWTATAGFKYNPFIFGDEGAEFTSRQRSFAAGARYWPWHVYSGWWFSGKMQWQEFNVGGITGRRSKEGDRMGAGAAVGFTYMLGKHLNLDFGAGFWAGYEDYTVYLCPVCGVTEEAGKKLFLLPNDVAVALSYIF